MSISPEDAAIFFAGVLVAIFTSYLVNFVMIEYFNLRDREHEERGEHRPISEIRRNYRSSLIILIGITIIYIILFLVAMNLIPLQNNQNEDAPSPNVTINNSYYTYNISSITIVNNNSCNCRCEYSFDDFFKKPSIPLK